jgi:S-adenosylmethionine/arginine decarboxylase-like enzyme
MNSNLAKNIFRKRLIIEGLYKKEIQSQDFVENFLRRLSEEMKMTIIAGPFVSSANGKSIPLHDGFEGSLVWAESGANTYIWINSNFATIDIYSCKEFDTIQTIDFVLKEFDMEEFSYYEIPDALTHDEDVRTETRSTEGKGVGVFAKTHIPAGTKISYVDGQIHFAEKESKVFKFAANHAVPFHKYFYRNGFNTNAVKLNHSCEPNCYVKDLFFVTTLKDIEPGEELTYSYSLFCNSDWQNPEEKCFCGSLNCLGKILPWRDLPVDLKKKYINYTADWILFEEMKSKGYLEYLINDIK